MKSLLVSSLSLFAASIVTTGCGSSVEGASTLRFSAIPDQNATELEERFGAVAAYLSAELGVPVEYVATSDYTASVEYFKNGDVQLAWFGGLTGVRARVAVDGATAIAQGKVDPLFKSYFIANASTGIALSDSFPLELEGKTFTFGSASSTSGRLMPEHFVRANTGRAPQDFFAGAQMNFSGDHAKTALLVQDGSFDAGVLNYKVYDSMVADGKIDPTVCVKIWETPAYPDYNWTAHPSLDETFGAGFTQRVTAALIGMTDPALLAACQREEGIIPATNAEFEPLEIVARELELLR